jgi:hypothetical protein
MRLSIEAADAQLDGIGRSADLFLLDARLDACAVRFGNAELSARICAAADFGAVFVTRSTAFNPETPTEAWASVGAVLRAQWAATPRFFLEASGGPDVPLYRTRYFFQGAETVFVVPTVTGRVGLGLGLRL